MGEKPLMLDREFSYLELMQDLVIEEVNFVIRPKVGTHFFDQEGIQVALNFKMGETRILNKVFYMGKVFVNVVVSDRLVRKDSSGSLPICPPNRGYHFMNNA